MNTIKIKCAFCGVNLPLPKVVFKFGIPNLTCPYCKKTFKPTVESVEQSQLNQQNRVPDDSNVEKTEVIRREDEAKAWLELETNDGIKKYRITETKNIVGRKSSESNADIPLDIDDKAISRRHFQIKKEVLLGNNIRYILSDANSSNGTFINTSGLMKITSDDEYILQNGDVILAGETSVTFRLSENKPIIHSTTPSTSTVLIRKP